MSDNSLPIRLAGRQPLLILHQPEPGEYWVFASGAIVAHLNSCDLGNNETCWLWHLTGPAAGDDEAGTSGECSTLLAARNAIGAALLAGPRAMTGEPAPTQEKV
jgi:hypothetical protein